MFNSLPTPNRVQEILPNGIPKHLQTKEMNNICWVQQIVLNAKLTVSMGGHTIQVIFTLNHKQFEQMTV